MLLYAIEDGLFTRCPDCNAVIYVPTTISTPELLKRMSEDELNGEMVIDGHRFHDVMIEHVNINPDIHPTFTKPKGASGHSKPCRHLRCMIIRGMLAVLIGLWNKLGKVIERWLGSSKK